MAAVLHLTKSQRTIKLSANKEGMKALGQLIAFEMSYQGVTPWDIANGTKWAVSDQCVRNYVKIPPLARGPFLWKVLEIMGFLGYECLVRKPGRDQ